MYNTSRWPTPKTPTLNFCGGGCFKGKAYINSNILLLEPEWQTAVAIGYDTHYDTALHEVAHSLGLNHTSECNAMSLPGWDERTQTLLPIATHSDLMTPCKNRWVSADITPKLHQRLIELQTFTTIDAPSRPHRILSIRADSSTSWWDRKVACGSAARCRWRRECPGTGCLGRCTRSRPCAADRYRRL